MSRSARVRRVRTRDGFTLVELVVVMFILTLVAGVTVPAMLATGRPRDDDLTDAVRRLEGLFRLARDSAIRSGTAVTVVMDSATHLVWLVPDEPPVMSASDPGVARQTDSLTGGASPVGIATGDPRAGEVALLDEGTALEISPAVELRLMRARERFVFLPTGAAMGDSIVVAHANGSVRITLDPWTGDVVAR